MQGVPKWVHCRCGGQPTSKKKAAKKTTTKKKPTLRCRFFVTDAGNEPVRDWLKGLDATVRNEIGSDIQLTQWRWPIGKPLVDGLVTGSSR